MYFFAAFSPSGETDDDDDDDDDDVVVEDDEANTACPFSVDDDMPIDSLAGLLVHSQKSLQACWSDVFSDLIEPQLHFAQCCGETL